MTAPPRAILFTQQMLGPQARKTGMIFWAEALARRGYDTHVVTTQLSWLSRATRNPRLLSAPPQSINRWQDQGERLKGFVWVPPLHPAHRGPAFLYQLYPWLLPSAIRAVVADADLVVIESCAAVLLFNRLRTLAPPSARFVYCASDRLGTVDMHPMLAEELARTAAHYDLVRVPAAAMTIDFPADARVMIAPHGIDRAAFPPSPQSPFTDPGPHAVIAGDMLFDGESVAIMVESRPDITFHIFGRMDVGELATAPHVRVHGEVPFAALVPYLQHADLGIAPYKDRPAAHYLAQSSLKLIQYRYCQLPVVAPDFAAAAHANVHGYRVGDAGTIASALDGALATQRSTIRNDDIPNWDEVVARVLVAAGATPRSYSAA